MDFPAKAARRGQALPGRFLIRPLPARFDVTARAFIIGAFRRSDAGTGCYHEEKAT
jgi:hypothetical protein